MSVYIPQTKSCVRSEFILQDTGNTDEVGQTCKEQASQFVFSDPLTTR